MTLSKHSAPFGPVFLGLCLGMLAFSSGGCWTTKDDGEALKRDVTMLKRELSRNIRRAKEERIKLQSVLEKATALLTRNSADVGAQVERIQTQVNKVDGWMDESKQIVKELQTTFNEWKAKVDVKLEGLSGQSAGNTNAPVPEDKDSLFKKAETKLLAGDHQEARRLARHFINRFPTDPRLHKVQLMLGESYFAEQKFAPAIVEYKKIIEQHKKSTSMPDALFKIGMAFYQLKFCSDAQLFLSQLSKKHRKHSQIKRATKVLGLIKRYRRNRNMCRP